jgi:uncharacterized membrane protein YphA (DoxX/SURF4 family)
MQHGTSIHFRLRVIKYQLKMENGISLKTLKNAELLLRLTMIITLLVAGISKFCSNGNFHKYYLNLFLNPGLRINLPSFLIDTYLSLIPFIEVGIAIALITALKRRFFIVVWILYFISLEVGHYVLEEFTSVDLIVSIILFGVAAYILPAHEFSWLKNKSNFEK